MPAPERPRGSDPLVGLGTLLQLERDARQAEDELALAFLITNETWRLVPYDQGALLVLRGSRPMVRAVSSISAADRSGGFAGWLQRYGRSLARKGAGIQPVTAADAPAAVAAQWERWARPHGLWVPLSPPHGRAAAWLWLTRETPFKPGELTMLERLAETYGHAWMALAARRRLRHWLASLPVPRLLLWAGVAAAAAAVLSLPVAQSALAPAEVVAKSPMVVAAPLEGVVKDVFVQPNEPVAAGKVLFRLDPARLEVEVDVAEKAVAVAEANYLRAIQKSFTDAESKAERAMLKAKAEEAEAQLNYARRLLARAEVAAPQDGVAVFGGPDEWTGKPVRLGEGVLKIVDPAKVWLSIALPATDAVAIEPGAAVRLFLDVTPLDPVPARIVETSYAPVRNKNGVLVYELKAEFEGGSPRLGLTGTARLEGPKASLFAYLVRRPMIFLRRALAL